MDESVVKHVIELFYVDSKLSESFSNKEDKYMVIVEKAYEDAKRVCTGIAELN